MKFKSTWKDDRGREWPTPWPGQTLRYFKNTTHAALRAYVCRRDRFTCRRCKEKALDIPDGYDGRDLLMMRRMSGKRVILGYMVLDHILPQKQGGASHPSNLQLLCDGCNSSKNYRTMKYKIAQ